MSLLGSKSQLFMVAAPFKFDKPSPDDLVSAGKHSYGTISKGICTLHNICYNLFLPSIYIFF